MCHNWVGGVCALPIMPWTAFSALCKDAWNWIINQRFHPSAQWTRQGQKHSFILPGSCLPMWILSSHSRNGLVFSLPLHSECSANWLWFSIRASSASTFLHPFIPASPGHCSLLSDNFGPLDPHVAANSTFSDLRSSSGEPKSSPYQLSPLSDAFENPENLNDRRSWPSVEPTHRCNPTPAGLPGGQAALAECLQWMWNSCHTSYSSPICAALAESSSSESKEK